MPSRIDPEHIAWCRQHFAMMADGGHWGVPRNNLVFQKRGDTLVLIQRLPPNQTGDSIQIGELLLGLKPNTSPNEIANLKRKFEEYQESEFISTKQHFEAAGIPVLDESRNRNQQKDTAITLEAGQTVFDGASRTMH